ncbi:MAG: Ig-like domain-containing protein [Muribaculaceae bacterium]|nr:Ig-like domain-containing protein [Muribaculaceae bacterium]
MTNKVMKFLCTLAFLAVLLPAQAFKDIRIDFTNGNLLTDEEKTEPYTITTFGIAIGENGTPTRVAADAADAAIVITGKYHSPEHGLGNFSSTVKVDGPTKFSMGTCQWGGDVTVKNGDETVVTFDTNNGTCFHQNKTENIVSGNYKGEAATLTFAGGSYTPYIAVEAIEGEIVEDVVLTFGLGSYTDCGKAPEALKGEPGTKVTIPANYTMYVEGKTLTGWNDGSKTYKAGDEYTLSENVTLTPVFTDNTVALADRRAEVTVKWNFERRYGAPTVGYQNVNTIWVTQAIVNGETIDVKMDLDTNNGGKFANGNWTDWCQINNGTKLIAPSCKGAVVKMQSFENAVGTLVNGDDANVTALDWAYEVGSDAETVTVEPKGGSYYRFLTVVLPYIKPSAAGTVYDKEPAWVTWPFNSEELDKSDVTPENGFSMTGVELNGATYAGTGTSVHADGITFAKIKPANGASDVVEWSLKPAKGLTFTPTKISTYICRFGTDSENGVTIKAKKADGEYITLGNYTAPRNNQDATADKFSGNSNYIAHVTITLTEEQQKQLASTDGFTLAASIGVGNTKEGGFSQVNVEGLLDGTIEEVAKYTITGVVKPEDAGTVTLYPKSETYDEGSVVRLTAAKNFGYEFVNWTDDAGKEVAATEVYNHTVTADAVLTANFKKLNTYELAYSVAGGANAYQVQATPAPNVVEGKNMYEEGTTVTLTAISNPVVTFTNWSDGQSSAEITVKMDSDKELVANFDTEDYVVGWDFYMPGANGRPADFASEDNDVATLVLRNEEGKSEGWLDKSEVAAGGYEGRPGAVNWRTYELGDFYWQTMINAEAFTDMKIITAMCYNYNAYTRQDVEYSLDGNTWTKLGTITLDGAKKWVDAEFELPAAANNQKEVYVRWKSDKTSPKAGTESNNDGIALGATFITGTMKLVDDGTAPVLVSQVPEEGSKTASINGKIVLTFDEKVKIKEGTTATLNGIELTPSVTGKTVMFQYKNLTYATDYKFTLAANTVADLTDNYSDKAVTINFTTRTRPEVDKALYDFIVPDDGKLEEAFAASEARADKTARFRIFIKNGDYVLPASTTATKNGTDGKAYPDPTTSLNAPNVSIIGESLEGVVITNSVPASPSAGGNVLEGIGNGDVLRLNGSAQNYYFQNLTMKSAMGDNHGRDIVLNDNANKTIFKDACLWAYQDTYVSNNEGGRFYYEGGLLRGRTDFLCGKGDVYYNAVTLQMCETGGYLAVPSVPKQYGYIFKDCEIIAEKEGIDGNYTLGRPWGSGTPIALYIDTRMIARPSAVGWNDMGTDGYPKRFAEYNSVTENGTVIDLKDRKKSFGSGHENNPILTKEEADYNSYERVMGGDDDWDPASLAEQAPAPTNVVLDGTSLTWDDNKYALLWAIVKNGKVVDFTTEPSYTVDDANATYAVRAANEMGGLGEAIAAVGAGVENILATDNVVNTVYYNVEGIRVSPEYKGIVIKVDTLASGEKVATKIVNK